MNMLKSEPHAIIEKRSTRVVSIMICVVSTAIGGGCGAGYRDMLPSNLRGDETEAGGRSNLSSTQKADVYLSLGRSAERQGNLQEALRMYQSVVAKDPKSGEGHWRLAVCLDKSGNFDKSATHYAEALRHSPGNAEIFCDYGYSLSLQGRWQEAEAQLKQAVALAPDLRRAHNNLGVVLAQGAKLDDSFRSFQQGGLEFTDAHWNVAQSLIAQSRWNEARGEFQRILDFRPNDTVVAAELKAIDRMVVKLEKRNRQPGQADGALMRTSVSSQPDARK